MPNFENIDRLNDDRMSHYKEVYKNSTRWDGFGSLEGKTVIVYCEQGYGDIIQFSRYFRSIKNCEVILQCPKELHRLFEQFHFQMIDRQEMTLPPHDLHLLSLSLPFYYDYPEIKFPYLHAETEEIIADQLKIGIAWEGNPHHINNHARSCPLSLFKKINKGYLYMLSPGVHDRSLIENCEDMELYSIEINDFYDTAKLINAMDVIISVDTSVLHLAGALNKKTFALLPKEPDHRWIFNWYDSVTILQQKDQGWEGVFEELCGLI